MDICAVCKKLENTYENMFSYHNIKGQSLPSYFKSNKISCKEFNNDKIRIQIEEVYNMNYCVRICDNCFDYENNRLYKLSKK